MNFHRTARIESTEARYPRNGQGDSLHAPTVSPRKFWSILDRVRGHSREEEFSAHASLLAQAAELLAALQVVEDYISREGTRSDERFEVLYVTRAAIAKALR